MISEIAKSYERLPSSINFELSFHHKGKLPYGQYGCGIDIYSSSFNGLPDGHISEIINNIQNKNKQVYAMDAMGEGQVLRELEGLTGGAAVTLTDLRSYDQVKFDKSHNIEFIAKGITQLSTLITLQEYFRQNKITGFDLIMCRPIQGWECVGKTKKMQYFLTQRLYGILNNSGGILLIEYPGPPDNFEIIKKWIIKLQHLGFEVYYDGEHAVEFKKNEKQPLILPFID